ncbi:MAG: hypothetical protein ABIK89_07685, partial [Planctomycetota bacterium]
MTGVLALAAVYRFWQFPLYWKGLFSSLERISRGRGSFLAGGYSTEGVWFYFPLALLIKMPVPTLLLSILGAGLWLRRPMGHDERRELLWLAVPMLAYFTAAMTAKVQIGIRHLLPMLPFMLVFAGWAVSRLWDWGRRGRWALG